MQQMVWLVTLCAVLGVQADALAKGAVKTAAAVPVSVDTLTAAPLTINAGDSTTLSWSTTGAASLWMSADAGGDVGAVTGKTSITVKPVVTTRYALSASGGDGSMASKTVTVTVIQPSPPTIGAFSASPVSVVSGAPVTLSWSASNATSVAITPGVGIVTGNSVTVNPTANTTYTLKATNGAGSVTKTAKVTIAVVPTITSFTASAASVVSGNPVTLKWAATGATALSISPSIGVVSGTSVSVTPTANTTYVLTATSAAGSVSQSVDVAVTPPAPVPPVIGTFKAAPASITIGASTTLSWSVTGATALSVAPGPGTVSGTSVSVSPEANTAYVLTATNQFGTSTKTINVTVTPPLPVIGSFGATPNLINPGASSTLAWSVSGADSVTISPALTGGTGSSTVAASSSIGVQPAATTTYTITASNAGGKVTQSVLLAVAPQGTPVAHPRIWITPARVAALAQRAAAGDPAWVRLRNQCDTLATYSVTAPDGPTYRDNTINGEYEYSGYIEPAITLGLCYQVAKTVDSIRAAQYGAKERALLLALSDPTHHGAPTLDSGFGIRFYVPAIAIAYDWGWDLLTPYERAEAYTEINRWVASFEKSGFNREFPQGNYFAGYYFAKAVGTLATEGDNPQFDTMWSDWLNRVHYGMVQPYYQQWLSGGGVPDGWNYGPLETLNMTRPLLAVLTAKGIDLLGDAKQPMSYPDGHARWMTHFTWPNRKTVNDRGMLYTNNPNRPPSDVDGEWATEFSGLLRGLGGNNAGIMQQFTSDVRAFSSNGSNWVEFLYWDASATATAYTTDLSYRTGGDGQAAMRSSWETNAVWGAFQSGPFTAYDQNGEEYPDQGSLVIQRGSVQLLVNADGALTTPTPGTEDATEALWDQLHGDVLDQIGGVEKPRNNFNTYHSKRPGGYWGESSNGPGETKTTLSRFEDAGSYVLMRGANLEGMFMSGNPINGWSRDVAYLRPQLFVVYDRTSVDATNTDDWMAWHVIATPGEQAGAPGTHRFDVLNTRSAVGGNLYRGRVTTLLPAGNNVNVVDVFDSHKVFRLEVRGGGSTGKKTWLTVFDASASAATAASAAALTQANGNVTAGDVEGAVISGAAGSASAVVFSKSGNVLSGNLAVTLPAASTFCLFTDLQPGAGYAVTAGLQNGNVAVSVTPGGPFLATAQGSLSFNVGIDGAVTAAK